MNGSIAVRFGAAAIALALCAPHAQAQTPASRPAPAAPAAPAQQTAAPAAATPATQTANTTAASYVDSFSRSMYAFNASAASWAQWAGAQTGFAGSAASAGVARVFYNLVVEPVSAVTHFATGEFEKALVNVKRFAINSTYGVAGIYDRATDMGFQRAQADLGLALCKAGVPEGPYLVAPLMGPRTTRDAVADYLASSTIVNAVFTPVVYGGVLGIDGAATRLVLDEATALAAARELDPASKAVGADYAATRDAYLAQRRKRCAGQG